MIFLKSIKTSFDEDLNMNEMEMKARANHRNGNNCSASLAMGFEEVGEKDGIVSMRMGL